MVEKSKSLFPEMQKFYNTVLSLPTVDDTHNKSLYYLCGFISLVPHADEGL